MTGTKEPPNTTILPRTPTALPQRITAKRITKPATSIPNRLWNTRPRRTATRKMHTTNQKVSQANRKRPHRRNPKSVPKAPLSKVNRSTSRQVAYEFCAGTPITLQITYCFCVSRPWRSAREMIPEEFHLTSSVVESKVNRNSPDFEKNTRRLVDLLTEIKNQE